MPLTSEQRTELEALGPENVLVKLSLSGPGRNAAVAGFKSGLPSAGKITREDIEDWLVGQNIKEAKDRKSTLLWARIAGWAAIIAVGIGIVSLVVAAATLWFTIWPSK